ncbi:MAG: hypothetical protein ABIW02_03980, partial [Nitrosospira sp.]
MLFLLAQRINGDQAAREPSALPPMRFEGADLCAVAVVIENEPAALQLSCFCLLSNPFGERVADSIEMGVSAAAGQFI